MEPADRENHFRHGFLEPPDKVVEFFKVLRALAGLRVTHVDVEHRRAGVVAVLRRLHLFVPSNGDIAGIRGHPLRSVRCRVDDQRLHVLGIKRIVGVVHVAFSFNLGSNSLLAF